MNIVYKMPDVSTDSRYRESVYEAGARRRRDG